VTLGPTVARTATARRRGAVAAIAILIAALLLLATGAVADSTSDRTPLLLISIDGFRWDFLDRHPAPALRRLAAQGVAARSLIPVVPSKTFPNHYTIVTGLYPEHHGIVDNTMADEKLGRFSLGDRDAVSDGRWWGGEPIWATAQRQGLLAATCFWPGSEAEIAGVRPTYWMKYDASFDGDARVRTVLDWLDLPREKRPTLLTLYWSDVDSAAHRSGPDSADTAAAIARVDSWMELLLEGLEQRGLYDRVNLLVVSDHGMASTPANQMIHLEDYVDLDGVEITGGTPMLLVRPPPDRVESVRRALTGAHPALSVWRREHTPRRWHYRDHPRIPPLLVAADEGWNLRARREAEREGGASQSPPLGMHGYDPRLPSMQGILIGRGPGLASAARVGSIESIHLYELMCRLLAIEPARNDGSASAVKKLLARSLVDELTERARATATR
jgi:predicted AlkP superfamily pyrophosphatase or phosphodiesterase